VARKRTVFTVTVTADGVIFPPQFHAAVLAMTRYRKKRPDAKPGQVQIVLDYGQPTDGSSVGQ